MLAVNVPKHKFADRFHGPYLIIDKINDHNYIVHVNGTNKVVNISKMKAYKPNKYAEITATTLKNKIAAYNKKGVLENTNHPQKSSAVASGLAKLPLKNQSNHSDSSDSDQCVIITRSRSNKIANKLNKHSLDPIRSAGHVEIGPPTSETAVRDVNQDTVDDDEAQDEANLSRDINEVQHLPPIEFPEVNDNDLITLCEIERHEAARKPDPATSTSRNSEVLNRSSSLPNIASGTSLELDKSDKTGYNLRSSKKKQFISPIPKFKRLKKKKG